MRSENLRVGKETAEQREYRMQSGFTKVRGKYSFDDRQKAYCNTYIRVNKKNPSKAEMRAAGVGNGGDCPAGERVYKAAMAKLREG